MFLNKAGRLTLASPVLTSILAYPMQINWLPQSTCNLIDRLTRNFICKGIDNKGLNLVSWDKISLPKRFGGLGLRKARDVNISLLGKLVFQLQYKARKLWVSLLSCKYIQDD